MTDRTENFAEPTPTCEKTKLKAQTERKRADGKCLGNSKALRDDNAKCEPRRLVKSPKKIEAAPCFFFVIYTIIFLKQ